MTLTELRYIVTLAEEQHFGRTAERCHVSQPTLSVAVRKFEESLGIELFERTKTRVKLTATGQAIVNQSKTVLASAEHIKALADANRDQLQGPFKLGAIFTVAPYLLPQLIPHLQGQAPGLQLQLQEDYAGSLREKLRAGDLDAVLLSQPFTEPGVVSLDLFQEPLVLLAPKDHPLAYKERITSADLCTERVLLLAPGHCLRDQLLTLLPTLADTTETGGLPVSNSLETLKNMIAAGLGVSLLPRSAAQAGICQAGRLMARPLSIPGGEWRLVLAWRASFPRHKAIELLRRAIQTCSGAYWNFTTEPEEDTRSLLSAR